MRKIMTTAAAVALIGATSYADLQNVEVGGSLRIRSNHYFNLGDSAEVHTDASGVGEANQYTEQRTTVNLSADFSDDVSTFIEFDNYSDWGHSFRDEVGGNTGGSGDDDSNVNLYQAYINLDQVWDRDINVRIGRQEVQLGSEFLIGNNDTAGRYNGLSFDGIVATHSFDTFNVTLMNLKVDEGDKGGTLTDADTDLRGIYGTYSGFEDLVIDGYFLNVRIGTPGGSATENVELNTIGARVAGDWNQVDYEVEAAFQDGDAAVGSDFEGSAINAEVGYTFDTDLQPRVFAGYTLLEGDDGADEGFNRLFSDWEYSEFLGNTDITNMQILRLGGSIQATEKIGVSAVGAMFERDEEGLADDDVGSELGVYATYAYSEDVNIEVGYAHFFNGDAIEDANTPDDEDPDYLYAEISISF